MKTLARALLVSVVVASALIVAVFARRPLAVDLYSLAGDDEGILAAVAEATQSSIRVLCQSEREADECRKLFAFDKPVDPEAMMATLREKRRGILAWKSRRLLLDGETNRVMRSAMRRDYTGMGLFPKADDPWYFLNDFVFELKGAFDPSKLGGRVLLTGNAADLGEEDAAALIGLARRSDGRIALSGAPFHVHLATSSARKEINLIGSVSLAAVFLFGFVLFGNLRFALPTALALGAGFLAGTAAIMAMPGTPHVFTLLFGTSLIGMGVDYCYHAMSGSPVKTLTYALVTTSLTFASLLFSSVNVLNQMAVFTVVGLAVVYGAAVLFLRKNDVSSHSLKVKSPSWIGRVKILAFAAAAVGLLRVHTGNDLSLFHRMDGLLRSGEEKVASVFGAKNQKLVMVPLEKWQQENAALKAGLGDVSGDFLVAGDLPDSMLAKIKGVDYFFAPADLFAMAPVEGAITVNPRAELEAIFDRFEKETCILLAVAFAVLVLILAAFFRKRTLSYIMPLAAAIASTAGVLGWMGETVSFFHLICFFILSGLGIDYVIFHREAANSFGNPYVVRCSFFTSFVGFGLLSFTSFNVTRMLGTTLAAGLFFSYLFSLVVASRKDEESSSAWHEQRERGSGKIRLVLIWGIYRLMGKHVAKIIFIPILALIYAFAAPARKAIRQFSEVIGKKINSFRLMLNFAWSIFDKADACTFKKNLPRLKLDGDIEWMKGGCFILSTHVGCIEVLPALRQSSKVVGPTPKVNAFQQLGHNPLFTEFFLKYLDPQQLTLHAVENVGVETAVEMKAAIDRGEIVLMAADRLSAGSSSVLKHKFFGHECCWPKGVFRFARLMECPVYAVAAVSTGWNEYKVVGERIKGDLLAGYVAFLERIALSHPYQWYHFFPFFDRAASL